MPSISESTGQLRSSKLTSVSKDWLVYAYGASTSPSRRNKKHCFTYLIYMYFFTMQNCLKTRRFCLINKMTCSDNSRAFSQPWWFKGKSLQLPAGGHLWHSNRPKCKIQPNQRIYKFIPHLIIRDKINVHKKYEAEQKANNSKKKSIFFVWFSNLIWRFTNWPWLAHKVLLKYENIQSSFYKEIKTKQV